MRNLKSEDLLLFFTTWLSYSLCFLAGCLITGYLIAFPQVYKKPNYVNFLKFDEKGIYLCSTEDVDLTDYAVRRAGTKQLYSLRGVYLFEGIVSFIPLPKSFIRKKNALDLVRIEFIEGRRDY